jgi:hypothetical protein
MEGKGMYNCLKKGKTLKQDLLELESVILKTVKTAEQPPQPPSLGNDPSNMALSSWTRIQIPPSVRAPAINHQKCLSTDLLGKSTQPSPHTVLAISTADLEDFAGAQKSCQCAGRVLQVV